MIKYKNHRRPFIMDQSFETVVFATAVFDIHQHTELIIKGNLLEFWVIELAAECI